MVAKPHTPVSLDLHTYINKLTANSVNITNENKIIEWDRPMTSNNAKNFHFKENIENAQKKVRGTGIYGFTTLSLSVSINSLVGY